MAPNDDNQDLNPTYDDVLSVYRATLAEQAEALVMLNAQLVAAQRNVKELHEHIDGLDNELAALRPKKGAKGS